MQLLSKKWGNEPINDSVKSFKQTSMYDPLQPIKIHLIFILKRSIGLTSNTIFLCIILDFATTVLLILSN